MAVLMFLDGVLRNDKSAPIPNGMLLYRTLNQTQRVLLLCQDKEKADHWLRQHKINKLDDLVDESIPSIGEFPELRQVEYLRSLGPVDYVVTSNAELTKRLLEIGVTVLVFMNPIYIREEFRPDSKVGIKTWTSIVDEITRQQEAYMEDNRLS
jgi:rRNA-processing protein FCF1